jgi:hypothetical protein
MNSQGKRYVTGSNGADQLGSVRTLKDFATRPDQADHFENVRKILECRSLDQLAANLVDGKFLP